MSVKAIATAAAKLNVTFHGAEINDSCGRCLQNMSPYLQLPGVRAAIKAFEEISPALNDQSKISQLMHTASKSYGRGATAAVGAVECLVYCLKAGLVHGDIARESQLTKEFLFGDRKKAGFAVVFFKRLAFIEFIKVFSLSSSGHAGDEEKAKIFPRLGDFLEFAKFAVPKVAVGTVDAPVSDDEGRAETGIFNAAASKLEEFTASLTSRGKILANLLAKTHGAYFDEELFEIANAELKGGVLLFISCIRTFQHRT